MIGQPQQAWLASILDGTGIPVGLGVLLAPNHCVTCTHVVADALGLGRDADLSAGRRVIVRSWRANSEMAAKVVLAHRPDSSFQDPSQNICLLEVSGPSLAEATWNALAEQEPRPGNRICAYAPSKGTGPFREAAPYSLAERLSCGWWRLAPPAHMLAGATAIEADFSGSLAWDLDEDRPIGIVTRPLPGSGFVIPTALLRAVCASAPIAANWAKTTQGSDNLQNLSLDPRASEASDVFLCHNSLEKGRVRELASALRELGLKVWFDEWELRPGEAWQEALEHAIGSVRSAVIVVGPHGPSPWAKREMRAFLGEVDKRRIPLIPVLLPGVSNAPALPLFLQEFKWVDLRDGLTPEALDLLHRGITRARPSEIRTTPSDGAPAPIRYFQLSGVPLLPREYVPTPELEAAKRQLIAIDASPVAIAGYSVAALQGMAGVGKTTLAAALARDSSVRRAFPDGVFWFTLGQRPEHNLALLNRMIDALSGEASAFDSEIAARERARALLKDRACLVVLDDVWSAQHAVPFQILGERSKLLVTTRSIEVQRALGALAQTVDVLPNDHALQLLANYAAVAREQLPSEAHSIVAACGEHPLTLAMLGTLLRDKPASEWSSMRERLARMDLPLLAAALTDYPHKNLLASIEMSCAVLSPQNRARFLSLAVFPEDISIPVLALATYWQVESDEAQATVTALAESALVRLDAAGWLTMHDLLRDYVLSAAGVGVQELHTRMLSAYQSRYPGGLHTVPNDGYFHSHVAGHFRDAGRLRELRALLLDVRWLQACLAARDVNRLVSDLEILDLATDRPARLLRDALRRCVLNLHRRPNELLPQLAGRVSGSAESELQVAGQRAREQAQPPALVPMWGCLGLPDGALLRPFNASPAKVTAVALDAEARLVLMALDDGTASLLETQSGKLSRTLIHASCSSVAMSADGSRAISGSGDATIKLWKLDSDEPTHTLRSHEARVTAVAMSADGRRAVSASDDKTLKLWDVQTGELLRTLSHHTGRVVAVAMSADGSRAISGSDDKTARLWDLAQGHSHVLKQYGVRLTAVSLNADGTRAVVAAQDRTMTTWDIGRSAELATFKAATIPLSVALSPDGTRVLAGTVDGSVTLWDTVQRKCLREFRGHTGRVDAAALGAEGSRAVTGSVDGTMNVWDASSDAEELRTTDLHLGAVTVVGLSSDGVLAVTGSEDKTLAVRDPHSGKILVSVGAHDSRITALAISADGHRALSSSGTKLILWDAKRGKVLREISTKLSTRELLSLWFKGANKAEHLRIVNAVAINADGTRAFAALADHTLNLWDLRNGELLHGFVAHQSPIRAIAWSADAACILSGSDDKTLKLWNASSGKLLHTFRGHTAAVTSVALSADGSRVVSGSADRTLKLWDPRSGELLHTLVGHEDRVNAVAVTADGQRAFSCSEDRTVRIWHARGSEERIDSPVACYTADAPVRACATTSSGSLVVAGDASGRLHSLEVRLAMSDDRCA